MADPKSKLSELVHPQLKDVPDESVELSGYLGTSGGKYRMYPSLSDRSRYVEFSGDDVLAHAKHDDGRASVSLKPDATVRNVHGDVTSEARFLGGPVSTAYMSGAPHHAGGHVTPDIPYSLYPPCSPTHYLCPPTHFAPCAPTIFATCAHTCIATCAATCSPTCAATCAHTCSTCSVTCAPTCHATCAPTCYASVCCPTKGATHCFTCAPDCIPTRLNTGC
jgi:hypothetical protein